MRLFIAEKPSLARAIAAALPLPQRRYREHLQCGGGNVVAWCVGHILEPHMPEAYDRKFARWRLDDLPIVPSEWRLRAKEPSLLSSLRMLLRSAERVVHAGDPDREGQLLIDEVLDFVGYKGPVDRVLLRDLSPAAVARALDHLEPNARYRPLGEAALARQRADWLYGINMTRLYSLLGEAAGPRRVLSIGRVQTPVLGLVVARDQAIEDFHPAPFFVVTADVRTPAGDTVGVRWEALGLAPPEVDEEGRLLSEDRATAVAVRVREGSGRVASVTREEKSEPPPLPYSLADLQIDAARRLGLSAAEVASACQSLYEVHELTTYPRSDCAYLPKGQVGDAKAVLAAIGLQLPELADLAAGADVSLRSRAWNDAKVTAHHAIIPTASARPTPAALGPSERALYGLIARRYVAQFLPPHAYAATRVEVDLQGERFVVSGRETLVTGWRVAQPGQAVGSDETEEKTPTLPPLREGDPLSVASADCARRETKPPKPFTDATLLAAMVNIAAHVSDPRTKAILSEADGLGTPATRPKVIETLFERGFLERQGRVIVSTRVGRALASSVPPIALSPDMTAEWEAAMRAITERTLPLDAFLARIGAQLSALVAEGKTRRIVPPPPPAAPKGPSARTRRTRRS